MNDTAYVKPNGAIHDETAPVHFEEVRETSNQSDAIDKLIESLAKAQGEFKPIVKDTQNPFFKSKYADLATIIAATQPALSKHGLSVMQLPRVDAHQAGVKTIIAHSSGQWVSTELMLPAAQGSKFDAQTVGSALTYARRYALQAILGVAADADDDGNAAAGNNGSKGAAQETAKRQLEEKSKSDDPKVAAIAKEGLAKINAVDTSKDLKVQLQRSLEAQKNDALFDEIEGPLEHVRAFETSPAKGSRPYRKVAVGDVEMSLFDDFPLGDTTAFQVLDGAMPGDPVKFLIERKGKFTNIKDIKRIGPFHWEAGMPVIQRNA